MLNPTYPGVYVLERASGARAISGVATSITALVGTTRRGPLLAPRRIFSPRDYERIFGTGTMSGAMQEQVRLFFTNGGGEAFVTRVARDSDAASITLNTEEGAGNPTLTLTALEDGVDGNNLRSEISYDTASPEETFNLRLYRRVVQTDGTAVEADVETFTNLSMNPDDTRYVATRVNNVSTLVRVEVPGAPQAAGHTESTLYSGLLLPSADASAADTIRARLGGPGDYTLRVRHNGAPASVVSVTITGAHTLAEIIDAIADGIQDGLSADGITQTVNRREEDTGSFAQMVFDMPGASFEILSGPANDLAVPLMLTVGSGAVYVDQFALNRPAPTGFVSQIHSARSANDLAKLLAFAGHDKADITAWAITDGSAAGSPGDQPIVYPLPATGMVEGTRFTNGGGADASVGALANVQENLIAIANAVGADSNDRWRGEVHGYRLVLRPRFGTSDGGLGSTFATTATTDLGAGGEIFDNGDDYNVAAYTFGTNATGTGGGDFQDRAGATDGFDGFLPGNAEYQAAFDVMEREVDLFNLLVLPRARAEDGVQTDTQRKAAAILGSAFAAKERAMMLIDPPSTDPAISWDDAGEAATGSDALRIGVETRNSAVFWPRLLMSDGTYQDPAGPMAGLMARTDGTRGVWKAAAGLEATVRGIVGLEHRISDPENGLTNPKAVNTLRVFPSGVVAWGARTLVGFDGSGNVDDKYVPVRRTMLYIEESLYRGLQFAVFEPNDEPLWAQIRLAAGSFMNTMFRQGAFAGAKASDTYFVECDANTTTATDINLGIVNVVVGFAPLKPAEFIILTVTQIAGQVEV